MLGAVVDELAEALADGYIVELGELGHFSISLKCTHKVMNKKEIRAESIRFDNVHLRTSKGFKKKIHREIELERVGEFRRDYFQNGDTYRTTSPNVTGVPKEKRWNHPHGIQQADRSSPAESC